MPTPHTLAAALAAMTALAASAADAPSDAPPVNLDRVVVTAAKQAPHALPPDTPSPSFDIDAATLDTFTVVNAEDSLKYAPNLAVRKRYSGDNNAIVAVRGTSSRQSARTLVYADGLLLSNLLGSDFGFGPRWSVVGPREIRTVDVLYGPYSAAFPGNSLGATILIETRMPERFEADAALQWLQQDFDLFRSHSSHEGRHASAYIGTRAGAWSYLLSVDHLRNESQPLSYYTALRSTTPATANDVAVDGAAPWIDLFGRAGIALGINSEGETEADNAQVKLKLGWDIDTATRLTLSVVDWRQDTSNHTASWLRDADGNTVGSGGIAIDGQHYELPANAFAPADGESERRLYGFSLASTPDTGWSYELAASVFDVASDIAAVSAGDGAGPGSVTFGDGSGWRTLDARFAVRPDAFGGAHRIAFGYHFDHYQLDNATFDATDWRARTPTAFANAFSGRTRTQALYVQDAWTFASDWKLVAGLRHERWRAFDGKRAQADVHVDYAARSDAWTSPKLAFERKLGREWTTRLSLGRAVRLPTVSELFQGRISGTSVVNNDPDLQPERAFSKDLTFERRLDAGSLRLSLYEDDVRDALFSQTNTIAFPNVTNIQNVERVRTRGQEVEWEMRGLAAERFDFSLSVAHNDARTLENASNPASIGKRFYRIPEWRADALGTWLFSDAVSTTLGLRWSGRQYNTLDNTDIHPDTFGGTSDYLVLDARADFRLGDHASLAVGIDNATDRRYYVYHPYPGRTFLVEGKVSY